MRLTELKGIGEKTEELFKKLGIEDLESLAEFFPRDYEVFNAPVTIDEIGYKTFAAVKGVFTAPIFVRGNRSLKIATGTLRDEFGKTLKVTWFNAPYIKDSIEQGKPYVLRGRISRKYKTMQLDQPKVYSPEEYDLKIGKLFPVYSLTKGLNNNTISKAVCQAFENESVLAKVAADPIPDELRKELGLCSRLDAVRTMHFPANPEFFKKAVSRMSFEEIFLFIYAMKANNSSVKVDSTHVFEKSEKTAEFLDSLPFSLTNAQKKVIAEIDADMASGKVMNRLIQGDVGSGKTMVAISAMMNAAYSGAQAAMMAPTEVLANQHYETITGLFKEKKVNLKVGLLTGSMSALEKKVVYDALEDGRLDIVIGTHTLFQEKVKYKNLGLIITDEQHRFGIKQREALAEKGTAPHMIVMSATPIPRTLALIIYGDMDVSVIDELPASRKPIKNAVVDNSFKDNIYRFIEKQIAAGHQIYIICPLVEFSDGIDAENVEDYTEMLKDVLSEGITVGKLHGQMNAAKKNEIMERFSQGKIQVLVSTTVIEVGVDVPNATVMIIENANRFGLATLHQLRGRVGRGADQSYCIFVSDKKSKEAMERLEILKTSNNGFEIAAKDLEMRGPGEFMGVRQSGEFSFRNFDVYRDADMAVKALEAVNSIVSGEIKLSPREKACLEAKTSICKAGIVL